MEGPGTVSAAFHPARAVARPLGRLLLALLAAALLAAGFPPYGYVWLVPVALAPLAMAYVPASPREGARLGFAFGVAFYALHVYWFTGFHVLALPFVLLVAGGVFAVHGVVGSLFGGNPWIFTGTWVVLQYLLGHGPLAFPWSRVATALAADPLLVQPVRLVGELAWGGLFVLLGASVGVRLAGRRGFPGRWALVAGVVALGLLEGAWRLNSTRLRKTGPSVLLLQPNVESTWSPRPGRPDVENRLMKMTRRQARPGDLVVWPETVVRGYPFAIRGDSVVYRTERDRRRFRRRLSGEYELLLGVRFHDPRPDRLDHLNGAVHLDARRLPAGFYTKRIPVPGGEYVPGMGRVDWVTRLARSAGTIGIRPGTLGGHLYPTSSEGVLRTAVFICYEDAFPAFVRRQVRRGAGLLVNLSNDSWSRSRASHRQHFYRARLRAVETGRTLLRNGNTGVSAVLDPLGRAHGTLGPYRRGSVRGSVFAPMGPTPYLRWGDRLTAAAAGLFLVLGLLVGRRPKGVSPAAESG